jgi:hypothetical protein
VLTAFGYSSGGIPGFLNTTWILNTSAPPPTPEAAAGALGPPNTTCSYELLAGACGEGGYEPGLRIGLAPTSWGQPIWG